MIAKILRPTTLFNGVKYNTDKIDSGKGELLKAANFGLLEGLSNWRPQDFKNYLQAMSSRNKAVSKPQFHAVISAKERSMHQYQLLEAAEKWMTLMGYGNQPYLVVFHKDTAHNHVHIVTTRIDHDGRKISDAYEKLRAVSAIRKIMSQTHENLLSKALGYRFTTLPQLKMILAGKGQSDLLKDLDQARIKFNAPSKARAIQLKAIFKKYAPRYDTDGLTDYLKTKMGIELIFHAKDAQPAYGYTVLDHAQKNAYKGSEIMSLKDLIALQNTALQMTLDPQRPSTSRQQIVNHTNMPTLTVSIAQDTDDDQIHGPRRRRKRKARTNSR